MSQTKPIHALQFRLSGPTEGLRALRQITGPQRWRLRIWLKFPDGGDAERDILVSAPCDCSALMDIYHREVWELCSTASGEPVEVTAGGFDGYVLPRRELTSGQRVAESTHSPLQSA